MFPQTGLKRLTQGRNRGNKPLMRKVLPLLLLTGPWPEPVART